MRSGRRIAASQKLVKAFEAYLKKKGHEVCRLKIVPPGEAKPLSVICETEARTGLRPDERLGPAG